MALLHPANNERLEMHAFDIVAVLKFLIALDRSRLTKFSPEHLSSDETILFSHL
jgi:hypothetical protein